MDQAITFKGRGKAVLDQGRIILHVCPLCSQKNAPEIARKGLCNWCCYEPDLRDAMPLGLEDCRREERAAP